MQGLDRAEGNSRNRKAMSKKFDEFWNNDANFERFVTTQGFCLAAWNACKKEIIKELKKPENQFFGIEESCNDGISLDVIDKIEIEF